VTANQLEQHRLNAIIQSQRQARRLSYGMLRDKNWLPLAVPSSRAPANKKAGTISHSGVE
jgi:hypothetical protein